MPDLKVTDDSPQRVAYVDNSPETSVYTLPRVAGTSGQVITIDANGDCNFQNVGSIGSLGSIEFRALPYYDEAGAAGSDSPADLWDPTGKSITPEVYFNLSQVSYSATPTSNTWRYKNGWNGGLTFTGGTQNTGVTQPALEFATYDGTTLNPQVTGSFIYRDAGGTDHEFAFTVNWILIQEGAAGSDGAVGISARAVNLTATDQTIEYDTDGTNPDPSIVTITATAVNASESEDVYFEFFVNDENQDVSPAAAGDNSPFTNSFTLTSDATIGNPKKIEVQIREGSLSNPILARDQMTIFGLKQGSDAITISFTNDSHVLPTTSNGTVDYSNSGTDIEVFEGTNQLVYDEDSPHALSSYRVTAVGSNVDVDSSPTFDSEFLTSPLSLYSPEVGYVRRYGEVHNMSADSASIEYTITIRDSEGKERIFTRKQSLAKSLQGAEGSSGQGGRTVSLSAGDQIFEYNTAGQTPSPANTVITAQAFNTEESPIGDLFFEFFVDDEPQGSGPADLTGDNSPHIATFTYTPRADIGDMPDKIEVEIREGSAAGPVIARDQFTVFGVQQGTDAVTIAMDNESHTVSTNSAGDSPDLYLGSGTNFDVFEGATHLSYDDSDPFGNGTYRISATSSDITVGSASTSSGLDTPPDGGTSGKTRIFGDHSSMTGADAKIVYSVTVKRADSTEQTFTRTQSISKSADGEDGADAKTVRLTAADYVIEYDQSGKNPNVSGDSPSEEIILTATAQNFTDPYFKFTGDITEETSYTNGTSGDDADTFTFSVPADYSSTPKVIRVGVSEASADGPEIAFDSITIASVKEGSGAILVQLTNDSHVFPADSDGAVTDFTGSGTNIEVYEGATQLDYDGSGTTDGHFTVTASGTNITPGSVAEYDSPPDNSPEGYKASVDDHTGVADGIDTSTIVYTISGKRGNGDAFSITKNQTFSKGTTGATGSRTVKGILYYEYATEAGTCDSGDTTTMTHAIRAADWGDGEYNTGFEIVNLTQSLNADITGVNGTTGVITHASITDAWDDGVDQYVIRPLPDQDSNAEYNFTATGDSALSGVASNWSVQPPEVQLSKSYQRYWEVEFSATETGVTGSGPITFGTPVPSIRFGVNIQSDNFQAGLEGWQIKRDSGDAEFNNIIARGSLKGGKTGPRDYLAFQSPNDDSPAPFDADGIDSPPNRVHTGFYIGPDDRSPTSYDLIIGDDEHQLRFDGSKGRLDLKGVNNLGVAGAFEAKGNSSLPNTVIYDFANEGTSASSETNVSVRMYNGTLDAAANNSRVAHIVTRTADGGSGAGNTDGRYELKDANYGEMTGGATFTFEQFKFRDDPISGTVGTMLELQADGDAHFYKKVGIGRSPTGSYELDVLGDINFTGNLTQNGSTYGGSGGTLTGNGTANKISKWSGTSALTDSLITDDGSTVTVGGNLTVNGTTTTVNTTNTTITDNLLELNSGASSNSNDSGIIIERGSTGDNALFIWDESADKFALGTTTGTASSTGNITYTDAGLIAGSLDISGDLTSSGSARILLKKTDNNVSDHIQFFNGTTRVGEIGCEDTSWLRINQETATNIYTPRYIRSDGGFFVDGNTKGINGSGNFIGGTIAGASDYGTLLRSDANDSASGSIDFTGDVDFTNYLRTDEIRAYSSQDLTITCGESYGSLDKSSFNDEIIRLAGEGGVKVYASSDNLSSGLDKETILINSSGDMVVDRRLYVGNSTSYFFTDSGTRTAYTGGDFYIQSVDNYYNYATNQYLGNVSNDNIYFRGNTISGDTWKIEADGDFGIGTTTPSYKLDVNGTGRYTGLLSLGTNDTTVGNLTMYSTSSGSEGPQISMHVANTLGTGGSGNVDQWNIDVKNDDLRIFFDAIGFITMAGHQTVRANRSFTVEGAINSYEDITAFYSDERLKTRDGIIENPIEKVKSLTGFYFRGNEQAGKLGYDTEKRQVGLSAQEVEKVLPEVIKPAPVDNKYKTLDYAKVVPLLVEAIKEQQEQIENLQKKLEEMSK